MIINLSIKGYLSKFFEQSHYELELREGATLADLYDAIGDKFGASLPGSVWSHEKKKFRGPVSVSIGEKIIGDPVFPLADQQQISVTRYIIGG